MSDLERVYQYSFDYFGIEKAESYVLDFDKAFRSISENIKIRLTYNELREGVRGFQINFHIIFYKRLGDQMIVIRILHRSMDYKQHLSLS